MSPTRPPSSRRLHFYTRPGCGLCREALEWLEPVAREMGYAIEKVSIDEATEAVYYRYRYRIPVVALDGVDLAEGRIDRSALERSLRGEG